MKQGADSTAMELSVDLGMGFYGSQLVCFREKETVEIALAVYLMVGQVDFPWADDSG